jgi:flagellar basal-body rod protein FlgF
MQAFGEGQATRVFSMTERASQNFDSGALLTTGRDLDIAIEGQGWLTVQDASGEMAYTRNGHLRLTADGALETSNGKLVIGDNGPIYLPLPVNNIQINRDGVIMVQPEGAPVNAQEEVSRLNLVNPDVRMLVKGQDGLFRRKDGEVAQTDITVKVLGGTLESSNSSPLSDMTDMIALQRQFEMQLKMMKTAEEIDASSAALLRAF